MPPTLQEKISYILRHNPSNYLIAEIEERVKEDTFSSHDAWIVDRTYEEYIEASSNT